MDPVPECPHCHRLLEAISPAITAEALYEFVSAANKYLSRPRGNFSTDVLKAAIKKHDIALHKTGILLTTDEKEIIRLPCGYEDERIRFWGYIEGAATRLHAQQQVRDLNKNTNDKATEDVAAEKDNAINKQGLSGEDERPRPDPVVIRNAKKAIVKYKRICKQEIREKNDDLNSAQWGLEVIDGKYKKARDVVKKAIDDATDPEDDQAEKVDKARAERLLQCLRTVWLDARRYFLEGSDETIGDDCDMEEYALGLL
ncbi:hypothetical protein F5B21DRAFT_528901 [Xylaria acuta]|nr:hypothetical protein F5B21DRAFT_528901 [Xylaria acuta]